MSSSERMWSWAARRGAQCAEAGVYSFGIATVGEKSYIPDGVRIGKNTAISGVTKPEDYPEGRLESGRVIKAKDGDKA